MLRIYTGSPQDKQYTYMHRLTRGQRVHIDRLNRGQTVHIHSIGGASPPPHTHTLFSEMAVNIINTYTFLLGAEHRF